MQDYKTQYNHVLNVQEAVKLKLFFQEYCIIESNQEMSLSASNK